ncbi:hypothetical protein RIF29_22004 [Crotalaria pallida]|uniref:Uncharacterized protein n=1 Tax=Crotalaria pallida TaxID=3830 RepID=A0AAN9F3L5_CROPI
MDLAMKNYSEHEAATSFEKIKEEFKVLLRENEEMKKENKILKEERDRMSRKTLEMSVKGLENDIRSFMKAQKDRDDLFLISSTAVLSVAVVTFVALIASR